MPLADTAQLAQIEALERDAIVRSLQENSGGKAAAADALGMSRATTTARSRGSASPEETRLPASPAQYAITNVVSACALRPR